MSARNYNSTDTSHTDAADVPLFGDQQPRVSIFVGFFNMFEIPLDLGCVQDYSS